MLKYYIYIYIYILCCYSYICMHACLIIQCNLYRNNYQLWNRFTNDNSSVYRNDTSEFLLQCFNQCTRPYYMCVWIWSKVVCYMHSYMYWWACRILQFMYRATLMICGSNLIWLAKHLNYTWQWTSMVKLMWWLHQLIMIGICSHSDILKHRLRMEKLCPIR